MIAYCMGGGIGDVILGLPVIRKLQALLKEKFVIFYCDGNLTPLLSTLQDVELRFFETYYWDSQLDCVKNAVSDCSLIIWNRFEGDNDDKCNYFYANDLKWLDFVREKRELYSRNLSKELGRPIGDLQEEAGTGMMLELAFDSNYFSDWNRFGIDVGYEDVSMEVPEEIEQKHASSIARLGRYAIFHDSRLPFPGKTRVHWIKCWYLDRWNELSRKVGEFYGCQVVQLRSEDSPKFDGTIDHSDIIGSDATFFDYLCLLKHSVLYVGTDSWPAHAAVFLPQTAFVILKGASVRRWDHMNRYTGVLRKGNCQGCEYVGLDECVFGRGARGCMDAIAVSDVEETIKSQLKSHRGQGI